MTTILTCVELVVFSRFVLDVDLYVKFVVKEIPYSPFNWILLPYVLHAAPATMLAVSVPFAVLDVSGVKRGICLREDLKNQ